MAKFENGINGGFSGKVGSIVGASWRGISYMRGLPPKRKRRKKTEKLKVANSSFAFLNTFLTPFQPFIKIGFMHQAIRKTERNVAHSENYYSNLVGPYPEFAVDYTRLILSKGNLPPVTDTILVLQDGTLKITWEPNNVNQANGDDQVMLVIYDKVQKKTAGFIGVVNRSSGGCSFELSQRMADSSLEVYLSLTSWDRSLISDSQYLGSIIAS